MGLAATCRPGQSAFLVPHLPFWIQHLSLLSARKGSRWLWPVAQRPPRGEGLRGTEAGERVPSSPKETRRVPSASFMLAAGRYLRRQTFPLRFRGECHLVEEGPQFQQVFSQDAGDPSYMPSPLGLASSLPGGLPMYNSRRRKLQARRIFVSRPSCFRLQRHVRGTGRL